MKLLILKRYCKTVKLHILLDLQSPLQCGSIPMRDSCQVQPEIAGSLSEIISFQGSTLTFFATRPVGPAADKVTVPDPKFTSPDLLNKKVTISSEMYSVYIYYTYMYMYFSSFNYERKMLKGLRVPVTF